MDKNRIISCSRPEHSATVLALFGVVILISAGCEQGQAPDTKNSKVASSKETNSTMADSTNRVLLDEANAAGRWFRAKKTRPIRAKRLEAAQTVKTLEGEEQVAAGHYLCRGEAGDIWPQTEKDLNRRYASTDDIDADGWRKYLPNPDAEGVMATQIDHPFVVEATWGKLSGKSGDFLVKNFHDRDTADPSDIWIVDQSPFLQTYEATSEED